MIDYRTVVIQGDLSRLDVRVLLELCAHKRVVEFGMGGSTLLLARICKELISYDTSMEWLERTKARLEDIQGELSCIPTLLLTAGEEEDICECDVLFIDGKGEDRHKWLKFFTKCKILICHDSLGDTGGSGPTLLHIMSELYSNMDIVKNLDRTDYHYLGSNMVVTYKRENPINFVNWNIIEIENRISPYA